MAITNISITPQFGNNTVTAINCGTSAPKLSGTIDISAFPNLTGFTCNNNDITQVTGYEENSNCISINFYNNKVIGPIPSLSALTQIQEFFCANNNMTGPIPSLSANVQLKDFFCSANQLTGSIPSLSANTQLRVFYCYSNQLTGPIPSLSANSVLTDFYCHTNNLTGPIPSLSANAQLRLFYCHENQLTGSIPSLSANAQLRVFFCNNNQLTGPIPTLSANMQLESFRCYVNQLDNFQGGSVSNTLGTFQAQNNLLPSSAVNSILAAFVAANKTTGTRVLNLGGTGNAAPTGAGITDKATLVSRGWTVTTN